MAIRFAIIRINQPFKGRLWTKIEEQADFELRCVQVVQKLFPICVNESVRGLDFNDDATLDDHVRPKLANPNVIVPYIDSSLTLCLQATFLQ
ncbi:MAG TPA: hypothetical protein VJ717_17460, partial [Gemmatimonadaceae bacterium]|nr:hypothetical protein [Gemmatimonadaceae bacterium]